VRESQLLLNVVDVHGGTKAGIVSKLRNLEASEATAAVAVPPCGATG
jgi:hypothetical protein